MHVFCVRALWIHPEPVWSAWCPGMSRSSLKKPAYMPKHTFNGIWGLNQKAMTIQYYFPCCASDQHPNTPSWHAIVSQCCRHTQSWQSSTQTAFRAVWPAASGHTTQGCRARNASWCWGAPFALLRLSPHLGDSGPLRNQAEGEHRVRTFLTSSYCNLAHDLNSFQQVGRLLSPEIRSAPPLICQVLRLVHSYDSRLAHVYMSLSVS